MIQKILLPTILVLCVIVCGCVTMSLLNSSTENLINYALAENGASVEVSRDNAIHPASTLVNGIRTSDKWHSGEGWEQTYAKSARRRSYGGSV